LGVINTISRNRVTDTAGVDRVFADANGDGEVTPADALKVINELSRSRRGGAPQSPGMEIASFKTLSSAPSVTTEQVRRGGK
jgi:hypothetical protein